MESRSRAALLLSAAVLWLVSLPGKSNATSCFDQPCNFGTCKDGFFPGTYTCTCLATFYGDNCQYSTALDACSNQPCNNGGTCSTSGGSSTYSCSCTSSWYGPQCQYGYSTTTCSSSYCNSNGDCSYNSLGLKTCSCASGYTGAFCASQTSCSSSYCNYNGDCTSNSLGVQTCSCDIGYTGVFCDSDDIDSAISAVTSLSSTSIAFIILGVVVAFVIVGGLIGRSARRRRLYLNRNQPLLSSVSQVGGGTTTTTTATSGQCQMVAVSQNRGPGRSGNATSTVVLATSPAPTVAHTVAPPNAPNIPPQTKYAEYNASNMPQAPYSAGSAMPQPAYNPHDAGTKVPQPEYHPAMPQPPYPPHDAGMAKPPQPAFNPHHSGNAMPPQQGYNPPGYVPGYSPAYATGASGTPQAGVDVSSADQVAGMPPPPAYGDTIPPYPGA